MNNWLPDDFNEDTMDERAVRALQGVRFLESRRKRRVRLAATAGAAGLVLAVAALVALPRLFPDPIRSLPAPAQMAKALPDLPVTPYQGPSHKPLAAAPAPLPEIPTAKVPEDGSKPRFKPETLPVQLAKAGDAVALTWPGDKDRDYVVYRCTSPRFDACTTAGTVHGTEWTDPEMDSPGVVFYKVEPRTRA